MAKFDWKTFSYDLRMKMAHQHLNNLQLCNEIGILPSTLSRVLSKGKTCNVDTVLKLCLWLRKVPTIYMK